MNSTKSSALHRNPEHAYHGKPSQELPLFDKFAGERADPTLADRSCAAMTSPAIPQAPTRRGSPATSFQAAASVTNLGRTKDRILLVLDVYGPMSDEQLHAHFQKFVEFPVSPSGLRTRRSWLVDNGYVVDSGQRAKTAAKRDSIVWRRA